MGPRSWIQILSYVTLGALQAGAESERPLLTTKYGRLRGVMVPVKIDRTVHAFYGVPYAKPLMGSYRFAIPEPPKDWSSVREAAEYPPMCLQSAELLQRTYKSFGSGAEMKMPLFSEDCLYLNIYTPADRGQHATLPVMVFIHGGALLVGGAAFYDGSALSAYEDVVLVVIQYRLGILGFLCTADGQASGNYGFLDQVAALRWVQENIADFGGDPNAVTIFGESAGGVSVSVLMSSPLSKGLFHRAIAESGVALIPGVIVNETVDLLHFRDEVAAISGCEPAALVDCLRKKTTDQLLSVMSHMLLNASYILEEMDKETVEVNLKNFPYLDVTPHMIPSLLDEYFGGTDDPAELRNRFLDLCGDVSLVIPSLRTARYHRDSGFSVFFYEFQHRPSVLKDGRAAFVKSDHGDELMFVFGGPFLTDGTFFSMGDVPDDEKTLSKTIMKYWANFARSGNPNGPGLVLWPQFDHEENYLEINISQRSAKDLRPGKAEFWTKKIQRTPRKERTEL